MHVDPRRENNWLAIGFYSAMGLWMTLVLLRSLGVVRW
jgi:hypothetical protein